MFVFYFLYLGITNLKTLTMFKKISSLGKTLKKAEQKAINGGVGCTPYDCWYRYGGPWLTPDDFFCSNNVCGIEAI